MSNKAANIFSATAENITIAVNMLQMGELIAFPTETVYGLGANAENATAVAKIYAYKNRPNYNPLIIHVSGIEMAMRYGVFNERATALAEKFFPSALTLVVPLIANSVAENVLGGGETVAIRCPSHPIARALIAEANFGIAAPSANISGGISPTSAAHVRDEFANFPLMILDGGDCEIGLESTVIDCTSDELNILRHGAITLEDIAFNNQISSLKSPGQLASHYAPKSNLRINALSPHENELYLAFGEYQPAQNALPHLNLSESGDLFEAAHNLYAHLRQLDYIAQTMGATIACAKIPAHSIGIAINDRLGRAAYTK